MKKLLALAALVASSAFAGTVYQPVTVGAPCMIKPAGTDRVINASFISDVQSGTYIDYKYPLGPLSLFWPKEVPYTAVRISGPTIWIEIRTKDAVESVAIVQDVLQKVQSCAK